ncbi:hypothetical protein ACV1BL_25455 (plasmid) [Serratia marcescens]
MKATVRILLDEPNQYFSYGFMSTLMEHVREQGVRLTFTHSARDKMLADIVFVSAEQHQVRLRYLTRRQDTPAHQQIFLLNVAPLRDEHGSAAASTVFKIQLHLNADAV